MRTAESELSEHGLKVTNQRSLILDIIRHSHGHVDADQVYRLIHRKQPRVSLSTVYRTLQRFKDLGLIDELHFAEEHHHYELKPSAGHYHLVCLNCGRVIEFRYPLFDTLRRSVPEARNFEITGGEVSLMGYCEDCQQKDRR